MNSSFDQQQPKTASSEVVDYAQLFRGLSSYVPSISVDLRESANSSGEKVYADLTDALIIAQSQSNAGIQMYLPMPSEIANQQQQQQQPQQQQMILSQLMVHNKVPSELKLEGLEDTDPESSTNSRSSTSSSISFGNSSTSVSPVATRGRPQKIKPVKRLSTTSTTSSVSVTATPASSNATSTLAIETPRVTPRGRKPSGMANATASTPTRPNGKKTKKQQMLEDALKNQKPVVCFGNKVVPKETDEYFKRRENNNEAVKKCREKLTQKQREREERMKMLDDENKKLTGTVETLNKELNVLKNIIIQMNPQQKLPDYITNLFKQLEEES